MMKFYEDQQHDGYTHPAANVKNEHKSSWQLELNWFQPRICCQSQTFKANVGRVSNYSQYFVNMVVLLLWRRSVQVEQQTAAFPVGDWQTGRRTGRLAARQLSRHGQTESLSRTGSVEFQTRPSLQCLMETVAVRRKHCLLRLRENCPFRKLCRHTYGQFRGVMRSCQKL